MEGARRCGAQAVVALKSAPSTGSTSTQQASRQQCTGVHVYVCNGGSRCRLPAGRRPCKPARACPPAETTQQPRATAPFARHWWAQVPHWRSLCTRCQMGVGKEECMQAGGRTRQRERGAVGAGVVWAGVVQGGVAQCAT